MFVNVSIDVVFRKSQEDNSAGRFKSTVIEAERYLLEVSRYLHLNPKRGVVLGQGTPIERRERLRECRWSSYRGYAGLEKMKYVLRQ
jgi:hypothetical protein